MIFTERYSGFVDSLRSNCRLCLGAALGGPLKVDPTGAVVAESTIPITAIWDTGATRSAIDGRIAETLKLPPIQTVTIQTANGPFESFSTCVDLVLPGVVHIPNLVVTTMNTAGIDMLIGMDVITLGDFSISSFGGNMMFSFRLPSGHLLDFKEEEQKKLFNQPIRNAFPKVGRNDACPCGSDKKYKHCHGRGRL